MQILKEVNNMSDNKLSEEKPLSFFQMVSSVMASFIGVQSSENRERDFSRGKASQFIKVGILMTIVWYGAIYFLVNTILEK